MNLRNLDLNLLVALDALLTERHVSRAAARMGLSQSAMSNVLARLRQVFGDDLLVRTTAGMQPTARAEALREPLGLVLRQIARIYETEDVFDPAKATTTFGLRLSDLLAYLLLPPLLASVSRTAPGVGLDVLHLSPTQTVDALERDEIHAAVSMGLVHSGSIVSEVLLTDRMVCAMRPGHPLADGRLTLEAFMGASHLKVSMSPTDHRFVDDILRKGGRTRTVAVNVPHWLVVPQVLRETDLITVIPERIARRMGGDTLTWRRLPFTSAGFEWRLYRHRRHDGGRALDWLCTRIREAAHGIA